MIHKSSAFSRSPSTPILYANEMPLEKPDTSQIVPAVEIVAETMNDGEFLALIEGHAANN